MPTSQQQVMQALRDEIEALEERCPGYRSAVVDALADVIALERQNQSRALPIKKMVRDKCVALGDFLANGLAGGLEEAEGHDAPLP